MTENTFLNIDFYRTLLSVLIGGLISLGSVLIIEYLKNRKEKKERKRIIYNKLISSINSIRRIEISCLEHGMAFNYHKTIYRLNKKDEKTKQQAEYHQKMRDEIIGRLFEKSEVLDSHNLDYKIQCGNDEGFKKLMKSINQWPRPELSRFRNIKTMEELNEAYDSELNSKRNFTSNHFYNIVSDLENHISKKLL